MTAAMDPEEVREVQQAYFAAITPPIRKFGGSVEKYIGDAVLAVFGVPLSHEDDAERAVRAALAIQHALASGGLVAPQRAKPGVDNLQAASRPQASRSPLEDYHPPLQARIGVHTGLVVSVVDADGDFVVTGDAVNLASRLEEAAKPGTVLISRDTLRLVAHAFDYQPLGKLTVEGAAAPLPVYRVLASKPAAPKLRGIAGLDSPLVGRQAEFSALQEALDRLQGGAGGMITIVGEAGIGKSRLVAELRKWTNQRINEWANQSPGSESFTDSRRAPLAGPRSLSPVELRSRDPDRSFPSSSARRTPVAHSHWLEGRCLSYGTDVPYLLWLDVLHSALGVTQVDAPELVRDRLSRWVAELCPEQWEDVHTLLAAMLSLPLPGDGAQAQPLPQGRQLQLETTRAMETVLACLAGRQPTVLVCEDLHWADPSSLVLLDHLVPLVQRVPLLLICVMRLDKGHGSWRLRQRVARDLAGAHLDLWLQPLSAADSESLVGNLLEVPLAFHREEPEGVRPTFKGGEAVEFGLSLEEQPGALSLADVQRAFPLHIVDSILSRAEGNPFFIEEIIRSLIDSELLVQEASTGRWQVIQSAEELPIPETLQGVLMSRLDRLPEETCGVLQFAAVIGRVFQQQVLALVAQSPALEDHLLILQREGMIRRRVPSPQVEYIFKHCLTRDAAYQSLLLKKRPDAHRRVAEALEQCFAARLEECDERLAYHWEQAGEPRRSLDYRLRAGDRARRLGASQEAVTFYQAALVLLEVVGDPESLAFRRQVHEGLGDVYLVNLARHQEALAHYESCLALAETVQDRARLTRKVAVVHLLKGDLEQARACYERSLAHLKGQPPLAETSRVHAGLGYLLLSQNRWDEARGHVEAGLRIAEEIDDLRGMADAYNLKGIIAHYRGDLEACLRHLDHSLDLYRKLGDLPRISKACNNLGNSYRLLGRLDAALACVEEAIELARRSGDTREQALALVTMGEILLDRGEPEQAVTYLEPALALAEQSETVARVIMAHYVLGQAWLEVGKLADARCHLERAWNLSQATEHLRYAAEIHLALARLHGVLGSHQQASKDLAHARRFVASGRSQSFEGLILGCQGELCGQQGLWHDAVNHLERSLALVGSGRPSPLAGRAHLQLGLAYARRGEPGDRQLACAQLRRAEAIFGEMGAPGYLAEVRVQRRDLE